MPHAALPRTSKGRAGALQAFGISRNSPRGTWLGQVDLEQALCPACMSERHFIGRIHWAQRLPAFAGLAALVPKEEQSAECCKFWRNGAPPPAERGRRRLFGWFLESAVFGLAPGAGRAWLKGMLDADGAL
jgi:hypothetical protein